LHENAIGIKVVLAHVFSVTETEVPRSFSCYSASKPVFAWYRGRLAPRYFRSRAAILYPTHHYTRGLS